MIIHLTIVIIVFVDGGVDDVCVVWYSEAAHISELFGVVGDGVGRFTVVVRQSITNQNDLLMSGLWHINELHYLLLSN